MSEFSNIVFDPAWQTADVSLVEAGAGTGKTYNIQNMYLRLVAAQGLKVQEILVVTFTEAATHELRQRLRQILVKSREVLEGRLAPTDPDRPRIEATLALPVTSDSASSGDAPEPAADRQRRRVRLALTDFDAAAIFTIHGFCQRVLDRYAFECGHDPEAELMPNADALIGEVCRDWWRRQHYGTLAAARRMAFKSPAELAGLVRTLLKRVDAVVLPVSEEPGTEATRLVEHAEQIGEAEQAGEPPWKRYRGSPVKAAVALSEALAAVRLSAATGEEIDGRTLRALAELDAAAAFDPKKPTIHAAVADVLGEIRQCLAARMASVARDLASAVQQRIRASSLLTYDAMLTHVRDALRGENGPRLVDALRGEFKAAMVDEFQDTDPVQYDIFRTVFGTPDAAMPLLYVGDPKQAIYGFRNGDIFTYYAASHNVSPDRRYRLATNYRSEDALVTAVNTFFADRQPSGDEADAGAFLNANIRYEPLAANGVDPARRLLVNGQPDATPLRLWRYAVEGARLPGMDSLVAQDMYTDVAEEIVRLLSDVGTRIGERAISPADIAVLVMTHAEAERIGHELTRRGVNVERQSTGCVFDTDEARQMALVMQAMLMPRDPAAVRAALCTDLLPCSEAEIRHFADDRDGAGPEAGAFDAWLERFRAAGERWAHGAFIQAFRLLAEQAGLRAHLLQGADGARAVTNVLHLAELAHQAALGMQLSPPGLLRWFVRQLDASSRDPDDERFNVRPASDDEAVKVMTVFKSKGLEFPIVFVPTLWRRQPSVRQRGESWLTYHGKVAADGTAPLVLDLSTADTAGAEAAQAEREQEDVRLAYVALTRAVNRCYLLAVDGAGTATALQRLVARLDGLVPQAAELAVLGIRQATGPLYSDHSNTGHSAVSIPAKAGTTNTVCPDCEVFVVPPLGGNAHNEDCVLSPAERGLPLPVIPAGCGHASFSSLMPHDAAPRSQPGVQDVDAVDRDTGEDTAPVLPATAAADIFAIRAGAKTGNCWHSIFERIDFQATGDDIDAVVDEALDQYGICGWPAADGRVQQRRQAVKAMVRQVLAAPLPGGFCLGEVPLQSRRSELQFHFTLRQHGAAAPTRGIHDALDRHWRGDARNAAFLRRLKQAGHTLPLGFMTGYIDLVFQHRDRFYIVDWKSNRIGGTPESFDDAGLAGEMAMHGYYLQYLIYTVALDAFLRQRLDGYDYERHMGGVYYIFLRGVDGAVPGRGIFHERPAAGLIAALSHVLAAG